MKKTFQFLASPTGWRDATPLYFEDITEEEILFISQTFSKAYKTEVRCASVGHIIINETNKNEPLGNGQYIRNF